MVSRLGLHRLFPASVLKFSNKLTADYYFGTTSKEESILLHKIIHDTNPVFMLWAIDRLMNWTNKEERAILHIHGTHDRIFPLRPVQNTLQIQDGGHWMIFNKAGEVSALIDSYLEA